MAGYAILGLLAAFGLLSVMWTIFGALLPGAEGAAVVIYGRAEEARFWRLLWLRSLGLLHCPLLMVVEEGESAPLPEIEICSREALLSRLEQERNRFHGTGNGDHTGRHQRGGISEL